MLSFSSCSTTINKPKTPDRYTIVTFKGHIGKFRINCQRWLSQIRSQLSSLSQLSPKFRKVLFLHCSREALVGVGFNQRTNELNLRWVPLHFHTNQHGEVLVTPNSNVYIRGLRKGSGAQLHFQGDVYNQVELGSTYLLYKSTTE